VIGAEIESAQSGGDAAAKLQQEEDGKMASPVILCKTQ